MFHEIRTAKDLHKFDCPVTMCNCNTTCCPELLGDDLIAQIGSSDSQSDLRILHHPGCDQIL